MSASLKLEAMHAAIPRVPWAFTPVTELKAVADVLPQVIAVVKAAEVQDAQFADGKTPSLPERAAAILQVNLALKDLEKVLP